MKLKDTPIQRKLMRVILQTSGAVLILTCTAFFAYEYFSFLQTTKAQLSTLGEIIASNSTSSLAFDDAEDAGEILNALKAEPHIVGACLYDKDRRIYSRYPANAPDEAFPAAPGAQGYRYIKAHLEGFEPVIQGNKKLGTLYLKSDMGAMYDRILLYGGVGFIVVVFSFLVAYFLSKRLQKTITDPILTLADTARAISEQGDYGVRANKSGVDEVGLLTDAFNHMLAQIEAQNSEITAFSQKLEQKVQERTRELEQAKDDMEIVNDKLVKSNHDLEQFAYIASHDLQEPLRKIQMFTEMAEKKVDEKELLQNYFGKIKSSARRMSELIAAVLNYSRLSKNGQQYADTDLNTVLENIKTDFELLITEKNAVIESNKLPVVKGIPLQLHQLCLNLVSNALKFTDRRPVIRISSKVLRADEIDTVASPGASGNYLELIFSDNGIGFEQQYADQIFTIFQRLHDRHTYAGTGIGLALCKKIVENHQGFITARSEVGKGSTFCIYLPV